MSKKKLLKVSRNRKKTWKKHCDAEDVEEYLESNRFNERIGGSVAEKSDESLFIIEKEGNDDILDNLNEKTTNTKESKLKAITSDLKYFKILESQSKVMPIEARIGPKNKKRSFLNDDEKFAKLWPQKQIQYLRAKEEVENKKQIKADPKLRFNVYDIWADKKEPDPMDSDMNELIDYQEILKGSKPPKVPKHRYQKPSLLPSIEVPHSGQSYNPSAEDHKNLLEMAHNIEVQKIRKDEHLNRVVQNFYVSKAEAPTDHMWAQEMSHGLGLSDEEDELQSGLEDTEVLGSAKLIKTDTKKTKKQKRKELLRKQIEAKKKLEKSLKTKENEVFRLKTYKKEIQRKEKESTERQLRRSQRNIEKLYKPKRMSRYNYEAPDVELNLSYELSGSLRRMKTDGNLLEDRFKSIQRRNIIESRTKQTFKRKYKLKQISKKSCKEPIV